MKWLSDCISVAFINLGASSSSMFRRPCSDATPHNHRILPSSQVLYVGISFLCFHLTSAIIVRKAFPLVNKSNIVSPPWKAGAEVLIQATRLSKFRPILYRIGANCLWKVLSESSALSHPNLQLCIPSCVLYRNYHTAVHHCSHAKLSRRDVLQSGLSE